MNHKELTEIFRKLGAPDPEEWADSEINEGIPQLARFIFLKGAWEGVVPDNDEWISNVLRRYKDGEKEPYSGLGRSVKRMIECGVPKKDITEFARCIAAEMIFHIGYLLDDSSIVDGNDFIDWALVQLDNDGTPIKFISGLHESVLATDPTGREMRPKE